jgi:putative SOS response-associated peptidase YedK
VCNEFAQERAWREYCEMMAREALEIVSNEPPQLPTGSVRPSERAAILSAAPGGSKLELLAWGWPPYTGKGLVINLRSEKRKDPPRARGIAPMDRFYEYRGAKPPKSKFQFAPAINEPLGFAVAIRDGKFALLTTEPNADVAEIHDRMPVTLRLGDWRRWMTSEAWPADLVAPAQSGTLRANRVR